MASTTGQLSQEELRELLPADELTASITEYLVRTGEPLLLTQENRDARCGELNIKIVGTKPSDLVGAPLQQNKPFSSALANSKRLTKNLKKKSKIAKELKYYKPRYLISLNLLPMSPMIWRRFVSHHIGIALQRRKNAEALNQSNASLELQVAERTDELKQAVSQLQAEIKLMHDAFYDSLTGLMNLAFFIQRLELAVANKKRFAKNLFAVIFIDLDRFKLINDSLGHQAGDEFVIL